MRICFFIRDMSSPAGTERVTTVLANHLAERGYEVDVVTLTSTETYFELIESIRVYALGATNDRKFFLGYPLYVYKLLKLAFKRKYDVMINVAVMMIYASWVIKLVPGCRLISWEHYNINIKPRPLISGWSRYLAHALSAKVVLLTPQDESLYRQVFKNSTKLQYIPNPVTISSEEKANPEQTRIIAIGRYTAQKGFDILLDAWRLVCKEVQDWELQIVGDGEDRAMLEGKAVSLGIAQRVCFSRPTADVTGAYKSASIYVLSSRFEGMPLVLLEAMHMGLPVVAFDCKYGPAELIQSGYNGVLVENGNINQLADAILSLINDDKKRTIMSRNAVEASRRFSVDTISNEWLDLFTRIS